MNLDLINIYKIIRDMPQPLIELLNIFQSEFLTIPKDLRGTYYTEKKNLYNQLKVGDKYRN